MPRKRGGGINFLDALPSDGERRLMLAVLMDAIHALGRYRPSAPNLRVSRTWLRDRAWFKADDVSQPFSFVSICGALDLNADYVRRCVLDPTAPQRRVKVRRYAARVEESWLRQRKDQFTGGLPFDGQPKPAFALQAAESAR
jgi:hypothetical protein